MLFLISHNHILTLYSFRIGPIVFVDPINSIGVAVGISLLPWYSTATEWLTATLEYSVSLPQLQLRSENEQGRGLEE